MVPQADYDLIAAAFNATAANASNIQCSDTQCIIVNEPCNYDAMPSLTYILEKFDYTIGPSAYAQNTTYPECKLLVSPWSSNDTAVFGLPFFSEFVAQFDFGDNKVGFALSSSATAHAFIGSAALRPLGVCLVIIGCFAFFGLMIFGCSRYKHKQAYNRRVA